MRLLIELAPITCTMNNYIPIKPKNLTENQDQNHADIHPRLFHVCPDSCVTNDTDAVPGC